MCPLSSAHIDLPVPGCTLGGESLSLWSSVSDATIPLRSTVQGKSATKTTRDLGWVAVALYHAHQDVRMSVRISTALPI